MSRGIVANDLWVSYGPLPALAGTSLTVPTASVSYLVGPNGAGKSTLLRVLACLQRPDAGSACVDGIDVTRDPTAARSRVGYVGDERTPVRDLSVIENMQYVSRLRATGGEPEQFREVLEWAGLWRRRHTSAGALSRGMSRRLAIALAIQHRPTVLLLDEPHDGLDLEAASRLDDLLRRQAEGGGSVVLATHDLARAQISADQVNILARGHMVWTAAADELRSSDLDLVYSRVTRRRPSIPVEGIGADPTRGSSGVRPVRRDAGQPETPDRPHEAPLPGFYATVKAVLWKDLLVEARSREVVPPIVVFALLLAVVLQYSMPSEPAARLLLAPGALWVSLLLASTVGISRLLAGDGEGGGMQMLLLSPTDRGALFAGKWLSGYAFSVLALLLLMPPFVGLLGIPLDAAGVAALSAIALLALVGWSAAGVLFSAVTIGLRAREVLLPVVLYPLVLPLIGAAVRASSCLVAGNGEGLAESLALVAAYDVAFWVLGFLLFGRALEG